MTSEKQIDPILEMFKHLGIRRWTDIINLPKIKRECIMGITNNLQRIEQLTGECLHHADRKEYPQAHLILDAMEMNIHQVRRHLDHLQNVSDFCARPAGENTS